MDSARPLHTLTLCPGFGHAHTHTDALTHRPQYPCAPPPPVPMPIAAPRALTPSPSQPRSPPSHQGRLRGSRSASGTSPRERVELGEPPACLLPAPPGAIPEPGDPAPNLLPAQGRFGMGLGVPSLSGATSCSGDVLVAGGTAVPPVLDPRGTQGERPGLEQPHGEVLGGRTGGHTVPGGTDGCGDVAPAGTRPAAARSRAQWHGAGARGQVWCQTGPGQGV